MTIFLKAVSVFAVAFWPWVVATSVMLLGSQSTTNRTHIAGAIVAPFYPALIFGAYWATDVSLWGTPGSVLCLGSFVIISGVLYAFGYFNLAWSLLQGIDNAGYSVTRNGVYFNGRRIPEVDPKSFTPIKPANGYCEAEYYTDHHRVIRLGEVVAHADPETFRCLQENTIGSRYKDNFWADARAVFFNGKALEKSSPADFARLSHHYCQSNGNIYHANHLLRDADPATFTVLSEHFAKDKGHIFYNHSAILPMADPQSFQLITLHGNEPSYATDDKYMYLLYADVYSRPLEFVDRSTVAFLSDSYFKDAHAVYYRCFEKVRVIECADPATFELVNAATPFDAKDKHGFYYDGIAQNEGRCEAAAP